MAAALAGEAVHKPIVNADKTISAQNAVPLTPRTRQREVSMFNVSTQQAIILGVLLVFLFTIALIVMVVGWASSRMLEMQERHQH